MKNTATSTCRVGYDAGKRIKGRKHFFLVDTLGNLLASCVVAASCHDGTTAAKVWDALALGNELLDQVQTVFVDGDFGQRFCQQLARRGITVQVPTGVLAQKGSFFFIPSGGSWSAASPERATIDVWPKITNAKRPMPTSGSTWLIFADLLA